VLHPTFRRCLFWAHLFTGLIVGLILLMLAGTGLLMSFETQIIGRAEAAMVRQKANGDATALTAEELVGKFQQAGIKGKPSTLNFFADPDAPVAILVGRGNQHLFHPTTGEYLGKGAENVRRFFQINLSLHRWLTWPAAQPGDGGNRPQGGEPNKGVAWKDIGGHINAAGTLAFLFLLLSGLFLWIPKKRNWRAFKTVLTPQPRLKGRARDWNWHNLAGFWSSPLILTIAVTGCIMFYPWANKLLFQAVGEQPPAKREGLGGSAEMGGRGGKPAPIVATGLNLAKQAAANAMPAWQAMSLELPDHAEKPFVVTVTNAGRGRPDKRVKLTIDRTTLEVTAREGGFDKLSQGGRLRQIVRWLHTGEFGGMLGQGLAAFAALSTLVLIWTGFALAWRRLAKRKPAQAKA
jgi:uncharacterized iron-regulated membrane protein